MAVRQKVTVPSSLPILIEAEEAGQRDEEKWGEEAEQVSLSPTAL